MQNMDFQLSEITAPYRMQPDLGRMQAGQVRLHALDPGSELAAQKRAVVRTGQAVHQMPGFDPTPALRAIMRHAGMAQAHITTPLATAEKLALALEEDFAVVDAASGTVPWMCVCVPSHWAPEDKLGLGLAALHAPVADNQALLRAAGALLSLVTGGQCWQRHVWTITPSARHDQHPRRHTRMPWPTEPDPVSLARQCWLRVERQTFFPVMPGDGARPLPGPQAVFAIRVMLAPLTDCVQQPADARVLHAALHSMSEPVLQYKNLEPARDRLLRWLDDVGGRRAA